MKKMKTAPPSAGLFLILAITIKARDLKVS